MIKLGEVQELEVVKKMDFGVYLKSPEDEKGDNRILLPKKQVPENIEIGDKISVFVYRDSNDRVISTVNRPRIAIGEVGYLKVVEITKIGTFLNWGLEKDLFLPYKEQIGEIKNGGEYMVGLYVDKSDRLCATMNLFKVLKTDSPYNVNDLVKGTVFSLKRGLGAMIAVEGKYLGLIHEGEILKPLRSGDEVEVRISNIKEDGKLDLSLKDAPKLQIDRDGDKIFSALAKNKGYLPLNDNSDPAKINEMFGMSKGSFKKGVGRLMKKGIIEITKDGIKVSDKKEKPVFNNQDNNDRNKRFNSKDTNGKNRNFNSKDTNNKNRNFSSKDTNNKDRNYNSKDTNSKDRNYNSKDTNNKDRNYNSKDTNSKDRNFNSKDTNNKDRNYNSKDTNSKNKNFKSKDRTYIKK